MRNKAFSKRKFRYASTSAALTALIIAAVVVFNIIFSALGTKFLWYLDLTPELVFTLSDECFDLIENGDDSFENSISPIEMVEKFRTENKAYNEANGLNKGDAGWRDEDVMIEIIFCDDIDVIEASYYQKLVYHTALELAVEFPEYIEVVNHNIVRNPSAVSKYKQTANDYIDPSSVIITCGSEYRRYEIRSFYTFDTADAETPWAYNAEKKFAAGILAVTRAETPIACIVNNHGESLPSDTFITSLEDAGYAVEHLHLAKDEIPEDCRLLVVCNPQSDFGVADGINIDEISKLDKFLDAKNSLMVFMSPESPVLPNFEEYLEEWGIIFDRYTDTISGTTYPKLIADSSQAAVGDLSNYTIFSEYVTYGMGADITQKMRDVAVPPPVVFKNSMPITVSPLYELTRNENADDPTKSYNYASRYVDGVKRSIFDVFVTSENAVTYSNGSVVGRATENNPFKLMTITREERNTQESAYSAVNEASYVVACSSVDFLSESILSTSSYGNNDVIMSACRLIGQEPVPVGLDPKPFADTTIDTITTAEANRYTVILTVIPAIAALVCGVVIIVRRKNR